jgi:hypothetical protein
MLRRITEPNGTTLRKSGYFEHIAMKYANPETLFELVSAAYEKYTLNLPPRVGRIAEMLWQPNLYGFLSKAEGEEEDALFQVNTDEVIDEEIQQLLSEFYANNDQFFCSFRSSVSSIPHGFVLKKQGNGLLLIDPHGIPIGQPDSVFDERQLEDLLSFFPGIPIESFPCVFQGDKNTCGLWGMLMLLHPEKNAQQIEAMLQGIAKELGFPETNPKFNDYIVIMIFEEFVENGFADATEIAKYPQGEYMNGLGRCRKCGLPKQVRNNQKRIPRMKTDSSKRKK